MNRALPAYPDDPSDPPTDADSEAERLAAEGWPALRGTAAQRDARFVRALLSAQLALARVGPRRAR